MNYNKNIKNSKSETKLVELPQYFSRNMEMKL